MSTLSVVLDFASSSPTHCSFALIRVANAERSCCTPALRLENTSPSLSDFWLCVVEPQLVLVAAAAADMGINTFQITLLFSEARCGTGGGGLKCEIAFREDCCRPSLLLCRGGSMIRVHNQGSAALVVPVVVKHVAIERVAVAATAKAAAGVVVQLGHNSTHCSAVCDNGGAIPKFTIQSSRQSVRSTLRRGFRAQIFEANCCASDLSAAVRSEIEADDVLLDELLESKARTAAFRDGSILSIPPDAGDVDYIAALQVPLDLLEKCRDTVRTNSCQLFASREEFHRVWNSVVVVVIAASCSSLSGEMIEASFRSVLHEDDVRLTMVSAEEVAVRCL